MNRVAFFDVQLSAPKDISVPAMVGGDARVREAFVESVKIALAEMERFAAVRERRGHAAMREEIRLTGNFVGALSFTIRVAISIRRFMRTPCWQMRLGAKTGGSGSRSSKTKCCAPRLLPIGDFAPLPKVKAVDGAPRRRGLPRTEREAECFRVRRSRSTPVTSTRYLTGCRMGKSAAGSRTKNSSGASIAWFRLGRRSGGWAAKDTNASVEWRTEKTDFRFAVFNRTNVVHDRLLGLIARQLHMREEIRENIERSLSMSA